MNREQFNDMLGSKGKEWRETLDSGLAFSSSSNDCTEALSHCPPEEYESDRYAKYTGNHSDDIRYGKLGSDRIKNTLDSSYRYRFGSRHDNFLSIYIFNRLKTY